MRIGNSVLSSILFLAVAQASAQEKETPKEEHFKLKIKHAEFANGDSALVKLQKERYNAALEMVELHLLRVETGRDNIAGIGLAIERAIEAGFELKSNANDRQKLLEESVRFAKYVEEIVGRQYGAGIVSKSDVAMARYVRANAEIRLLREKETGKK
jgi:hypothetical protein